MAFSIFALESFINWAGVFANLNKRAEAGSVTSSRVRKLIMQLTSTAKGSFFWLITITLGTRKPRTAFFTLDKTLLIGNSMIILANTLFLPSKVILISKKVLILLI